MLTDKFPRAILSHTPTPLEFLKNISSNLGGADIWIKRDDCTGLAMGGNKSRQLEYYMGEAIARKAGETLAPRQGAKPPSRASDRHRMAETDRARGAQRVEREPKAAPKFTLIYNHLLID